MEINGRTEWISLAWQADSSDYTPSPHCVGAPPPQRAQSPCSSMYLEVHVLMKVISSMDKRAVFIVRTARAVVAVVTCVSCVGWPVVLVALEPAAA